MATAKTGVWMNYNPIAAAGVGGAAFNRGGAIANMCGQLQDKVRNQWATVVSTLGATRDEELFKHLWL